MSRSAVLHGARPGTHPASQVGDRAWLKTLGRVGIASRGVIYVVLAYLAFDIARFGRSPSQASSQGALQEVAKQPEGFILLIVLGIGLGAYGLWRLLQALAMRPNGASTKHPGIARVGAFLTAIIYAGLAVRAFELVAGRSSASTASSSSGNPGPLVAKVLGWHGGREILGIGGIALIIGGIALAIWGVTHNYDKSLQMERLSSKWQKVVKTLGGLGDIARGALVGLVGGYIVDAAVVNNSSHAKGLDAVLQSLAHQTYGFVILGLVAIGVLCFGLYSFFDARLRRL